MSKVVEVGKVSVGAKRPLVLIAGPCVIESREGCLEIAGKLVRLAKTQKISLIFKAACHCLTLANIQTDRNKVAVLVAINL